MEVFLFLILLLVVLLPRESHSRGGGCHLTTCRCGCVNLGNYESHKDMGAYGAVVCRKCGYTSHRPSPPRGTQETSEHYKQKCYDMMNPEYRKQYGANNS